MTVEDIGHPIPWACTKYKQTVQNCTRFWNIATVPEIGHTNLFRNGTGRTPGKNFILARSFKILNNIDHTSKGRICPWPPVRLEGGRSSCLYAASGETIRHHGQIHMDNATPHAKEYRS
jgi:hypothetical protein